MRSSRLFALAAAAAAVLSACSDRARISGTLSGGDGAEIVLQRLSGSALQVVDSVKANASGGYSFKMDVQKGQPEFVYLFSGGTRIASLLVQAGDRISVSSDTLGAYTVQGSAESEKLRQVEEEYSAFLKEFSDALEAGDGAASSRKYIDYYRSRIKYVMNNTGSLTSIPVLYQNVGDAFPVFSQTTDAIIFKTVHDSLKAAYPDSKYVAALGKEAERRFNSLTLEQRIAGAGEAGYPDMELPDTEGKKIRLGSVDSKAVLVYFWQSAEAAQKMFNQDVLLPLYKAYHPKGLEIYAVSLDTDKGLWASAVKSQALPWINVCDGLGAASPAVALYNITKGLPVAYLIVDGALTPDLITSEKDLQRVLASRLK